MNTVFNLKRHGLRTTAVAAAGFVLAMLVSGLLCTTLRAEEKSPAPPPITGRAVQQLLGASTEQALSEAKLRIKGQEHDLEKMKEKYGASHPNVVQAQRELDESLKLSALLERLKQLESGARDDGTKMEIDRIRNAISEMTLATLRDHTIPSLEPSEPIATRAELRALQQKLLESSQELSTRESQLLLLRKQLAAQELHRALPPIENGEVKIYALRHMPAQKAAEAVESLFGAQSMRVAVDDRTNSLIVFVKADSVPVIDAVLTRLDENADPGIGKTEKQAASAKASRSLLVKVFWLADNVPEGEGTDPAEVLPANVLRATKKLGVTAPRLVTQTVNSLAVGSEKPVNFSTSVPAILMKQPVVLNCSGQVKLDSDDRAGIEVRIEVMGQNVNCQLQGSLATPLGHYMVLGTANSVISNAPWNGMPGGTGMEAMGGGAVFAGGPEGLSAEDGFGQGGPRGGGRFVGGGPPVEGAMPGEQPQTAPTFSTSRVAFVVQVTEAESFAPEE